MIVIGLPAFIVITGIIGIVIILKAYSGMFGNDESPKEIAFTIAGLIVVYAFFVSFENYKYWVFNSILEFPGAMSSYFSNIVISGVSISSGESITETIWITIEKRIFSVFKHINPLSIFKSLWLIICSLLAAFFLFLLYFNYWLLYFLFAIEITILSIMGIVICFAAPFKIYRSTFINWIKAMVGSTLPIVIMALILLFLKVLIVEQSNDLSRAVGINNEVVVVSVQKIAFVSGITIVLAKKIPEWISILLGIQSNSFSLVNPARSIGNTAGRLATVAGAGVGATAAGLAIKGAKLGGKGAINAGLNKGAGALSSFAGIRDGVIGQGVKAMGKGAVGLAKKFGSLQGKK